MISSNTKTPFIKLPNNLVWGKNKENNEKSLVQQATELLGDSNTAAMIPEILAQLNWRVNRMNICTFTILGLIKSCGYTPKTGTNKSISKFRAVLTFLQDLGYISDLTLDPEESLETIATSTEITCSINNNFSRKGEEDTEFFIIDLDTYNALYTTSLASSFRRNIINIYFYLSARILYVPPGTKFDPNDKHRYFCYFGQGVITKDLGITKSTIVSCLKILGELELIYYGNIGSVQGTNSKGERGVIHARNIYAKTPEALKQGLEYSKSFYKNNEYILLKKPNKGGSI